MEMGLTHKDLAKALGVSETTIKSYRRKFPACIVVASKGKPIRFAPEAETVCRRIQALFALGMAVDEVRLRLAEEFAWIEPEFVHENDGVANADGQSVSLDKKALLDEAALLKEALRNTESPLGHVSSGPFMPEQKGAPEKNVSPERNVSLEQKSVVQQSVMPAPQNAPERQDASEQQEASEQKNSLPSTSAPKAAPETPRSTPYTTLPPEVRTAISDMARTVVELTLQQKKLLKQVERLEGRLDSALESLAHTSESAATNEPVIPQSVSSKTPIHEQIQADVEQVQETNSDSTPEQNKSRNPLLKIFGLERHG